MAKEEPHKLLGISRNSTRTEIKAAYYRQAKQWHPDKNNTDFAAERFKAAQGAMRSMLAQQVRLTTFKRSRALFPCRGRGKVCLLALARSSYIPCTVKRALEARNTVYQYRSQASPVNSAGSWCHKGLINGSAA